MDTEKRKTCFKIAVETPGAPVYYVYKESVALALKEKLDKTYGDNSRISLTKFERDPPPVEHAV